jgi:predicted nucleotide-binding protein (sugar kinase/HSP70/actin superfamily)
MPHIEEMFIENGNTRKEFSSTCIFIQGEAFWMRQIYKDRDFEGKIIAPTLNFNGGWQKGEAVFLEIAEKLGFSGTKASEAFAQAISVQEQFEEELSLIGKEALEELHRDKERIALVVLGRAYNAFADEANKGIPKKIATRGYLVIPHDMLPYQSEPIPALHEEYMHWEVGQEILRASAIIKRDPQLFGVYITNFLCAIDSLLVTYFRKLMSTKPSLTLELDGHTADAGINTRIEAFADIIKNYLQVQKQVKDASSNGFKKASIAIEHTGMFFIDSAGQRLSLKDPNVTMIVPAMGDLGNRALVAVFTKRGINAVALPVADNEALRFGRGVTTCKECLPMLICVGSMLKYLEHRKNPEEKLVIFQPRAAGYCRLGQYHVYMNMLIQERGLKDVAVLSLANEERYSGLGPTFAYAAWQAIIISDAMDDIRNTIMTIARDKESALTLFYEEYDKILAVMAGRTKGSIYRQLQATAKRLAGIELAMPYNKAPQVVVMGEIFVRRDSFSNGKIAAMLAERGFIARLSPVAEWIYYLNYMIKEGLHFSKHTLLGALEFFISDKTQQHVEKRMKKIFATSGLYTTELLDIKDMIRFSKRFLPNSLKGEPGLIIGVLMRDVLNKYAGIINIGPFGCMPVRFTEAVVANNIDLASKEAAYKSAGEVLQDLGLSPEDHIPFLTIECDGNPYPQLLEARFESFCLQASRVAEKQGKQAREKKITIN